MVRTFCSAIYLRLMIVMCFKKHLIFGDDPLFPDGKDFGDVSRQNIIMIDKKKVTFRGKVCENGRFYEVNVVMICI